MNKHKNLYETLFQSRVVLIHIQTLQGYQAMAENIKYIRWAAKILRGIMTFNIMFGITSFVSGLFIPVATASRGYALGTSAALLVNFEALVSIFILAFITYTASRALELLADIGYHLLMTWHRSQGS